MTSTPLSTWAQFRAGLQTIAEGEGEWAGVPMPAHHAPLEMEPRHPYATRLQGIELDDDGNPRRREEPENDGARVRNRWRSLERRTETIVWEEADGRIFGKALPMSMNRGAMELVTMGVIGTMDPFAEVQALHKLEEMVSEYQFHCYALSGTFLERSDRSGVFYFFRRLRPTLAMRADSPDPTKAVQVLAALCLHPIGYYQNTWAGAMVPTDDVIAHLTMMRCDEHLFWRKSNQHPAWHPEAGL